MSFSDKLGGYRALIIDDNSNNVRSWIKLFNDNQIESEICIDLDKLSIKLKDPHPHLLIINILFFKNNLFNLKKIFIHFDFSKTLIIVYPQKAYIFKENKKLIFQQINWPQSEEENKKLIIKIEKKLLSTGNKQMISGQSIVQILRPYLIFRSKIMRDGLELLPKIASTKYNVLILGETGTGKEMVAKAIHELSLVNKHPFITVNCAAIPESLVESELFGHEKGAFTGALSKRKGKFLKATNGTLFLDEIGDMPQNIQIKLLRAIEEKKITPIGSDESIEVSPRLIAATNIDLKTAVDQGKFREDLYYRLNVLLINLPPLNQRKEDVSLLAVHFLNEIAIELGIKPPLPFFNRESISYLENMPWPGNVRQLKNFITRLVVNLKESDNGSIGVDQIISNIFPSRLNGDILISESQKNGIYIPTGTTINQAKEMLINHTLNVNKGNISKSAKVLGISTRHLSRKVNETKKHTIKK